jgi:beta-lactamase class D
MSDGITEARRGTYFSGGIMTQEMTQEEYQKSVDLYYENLLEKIPDEYIERYIRKKKLNNIEPSKINSI